MVAAFIVFFLLECVYSFFSGTFLTHFFTLFLACFSFVFFGSLHLPIQTSSHYDTNNTLS